MEQFCESGRDVVVFLLALSKLISSFATQVQGMSCGHPSGGVSVCKGSGCCGHVHVNPSILGLGDAVSKLLLAAWLCLSYSGIPKGKCRSILKYGSRIA